MQSLVRPLRLIQDVVVGELTEGGTARRGGQLEVPRKKSEVEGGECRPGLRMK